MQKKTELVTIEMPFDLAAKLRAYVAEGWAGSEQEVILEGTRRHLHSHRPELIEKMVRDDIAWVLRERK